MSSSWRASVLVVDDEKAIRDSLRMILEFEDYRVDEAADGDAALRRVAERLPDAVLLDIKMPGLDGLAVLRMLRERGHDVPVLMITGHGDVQTAVEATRQGAFDFLEKPLARDRVLLSLRNAVESSRLQREARRVRAEGGENRFVHMRPNFAFLRDKMHQLIHAISTHAPQAKIVVSVSPVPLQATVSADDVVMSSTLSKSQLRVVAVDARSSFDHVDYFPSYEMVMNSARAATWEEDEIHVKMSLVAQVTRSFVENWLE